MAKIHYIIHITWEINLRKMLNPKWILKIETKKVDEHGSFEILKYLIDNLHMQLTSQFVYAWFTASIYCAIEKTNVFREKRHTFPFSFR